MKNNQVTLYVSDGLALNQNIRNTGVYVEANVSNLSLNIGECVSLSYYCSGNLLDEYYLNGTMIPDAKGTWGDWIDNNTVTLDIEGVSESKGYLRIFFIIVLMMNCLHIQTYL